MLQQDVVIDVDASLGSALMLVEVSEYFDYDNGTRLQDIAGYKYRLLMKDKSFHEVGVKIPGAKKMDADGCPMVELENPEINMYVINGKPVISVTAHGIHAIKDGVPKTPKMQ